MVPKIGEFLENPGNPRSFVLDFHQKPENLVSKSPGNHRYEVIGTVFKVKNAPKLSEIDFGFSSRRTRLISEITFQMSEISPKFGNLFGSK